MNIWQAYEEYYNDQESGGLTLILVCTNKIFCSLFLALVYAYMIPKYLDSVVINCYCPKVNGNANTFN